MVAVLSVPSLARNVFVAVLETVTLGTSISKAERAFLTDKLRSKAIEVLPTYNDFVIMTRDNILAMLPPGRSLEECEGECMVETGKNISADYVAQARVGQFGSDLTLTVELYETAGGKMLANYTSKNSSVDELLAEIEGRSAMLFGVIPGAVTSNAGFDDGRGGISDLSTGRQWSSSKVKKHLVEISTEPSGALLNVDGRPQSNCRSTPCTVELSEGNHKFTFVLDRYFDVDTVVMVNGGTDKLKAKMMPNFGRLVIEPEFPDNLGEPGGLTVQVDGETVPRKTELPPGRYSVVIEHACYEDVQFTATIARGKTLSYTKELIPKNGHVSISARQDDTPQKVPVYVNGKKAGMTPFDEDVSVCAKITVGDDKVEFPNEILAHEETEWVYEVPEEEEEENNSSYNSSHEEYKPKDHRFFLQGLGFIGAQQPENYEDDPDTGEGLAYYAVDAVLSYAKFGSFSLGVGLGLGFYLVSIEDEKSGSYYYDEKVSTESPFAPNVMLEAMLDRGYLIGLRYMFIWDVSSRYSSNRLSVFGELPSLAGMGMELGAAMTQTFGNSFFFSFTMRLPRWKTIEKKGWYKEVR